MRFSIQSQGVVPPLCVSQRKSTWALLGGQCSNSRQKRLDALSSIIWNNIILAGFWLCLHKLHWHSLALWWLTLEVQHHWAQLGASGWRPTRQELPWWRWRRTRDKLVSCFGNSLNINQQPACDGDGRSGLLRSSNSRHFHHMSNRNLYSGWWSIHKPSPPPVLLLVSYLHREPERLYPEPPVEGPAAPCPCSLWSRHGRTSLSTACVCWLPKRRRKLVNFSSILTGDCIDDIPQEVQNCLCNHKRFVCAGWRETTQQWGDSSSLFFSCETPCCHHAALNDWCLSVLQLTGGLMEVSELRSWKMCWFLLGFSSGNVSSLASTRQQTSKNL